MCVCVSYIPRGCHITHWGSLVQVRVQLLRPLKVQEGQLQLCFQRRGRPQGIEQDKLSVVKLSVESRKSIINLALYEE